MSLHCRAITALEEAAALDGAAGLPAEVWRGRLLCGLVASAVCDDDGALAFSSADAVARLPSDEADALCLEVGATLDRISPSYTRPGIKLWTDALTKGASHTSNFSSLYSLAHSECPTAYFGLPLRDLTDGHWMCFRAAHQIIEAKRNQ